MISSADRKHLINGIYQEFGVSDTFPDDVMEQVTQLPHVDISERKELSDWIMVTIDGEDAKDLDDAISVKKMKHGWYECLIAIADVAEYVLENSPIDRVAQKRTTSIYPSDSVIPMLPSEISNELCSLHPGSLKAVIAIHCRIDLTGKTSLIGVFEAVFRSAARLTYNEVQNIIDSWFAYTVQEMHPIVSMLEDAYDAYRILKKSALAWWKLQFCLDELLVRIQDWQPCGIKKRDRGEAHELIEEYMVLANASIATMFARNRIPFLYRTHEKPGYWHYDLLQNLTTEYGIDTTKQGYSDVWIFQQVLWKIHHTTIEWQIVLKKILWTLKKAKYHSSCWEHFWLGLRYYTHCTSPIRRYSDLVVHRIIKKWLHHQISAKTSINNNDWYLRKIARATTEGEILAKEIEYAVFHLDTTLYMQQFIGRSYECIILHSIPLGIFILNTSYVIDWFIPKKSLSRYWKYSHRHSCFLVKEGGIWKPMYAWTHMYATVKKCDISKRKIIYSIS